MTLRRSDGAIIMARYIYHSVSMYCHIKIFYSLSPFPAVLHQHFLAHQWANTVKLCRVAKVLAKIVI